MAGPVLLCRVILCAFALLLLKVKGLDHGGSDFFVAFLPIVAPNAIDQGKLFITTPERVPVNFTISAPGAGYFHRDTVDPGGVREFTFSGQDYALRSTTDRSKGIIITAENEGRVFVYVAQDVKGTSDSFLALPAHDIGAASYTYIAAMIHTLDRVYVSGRYRDNHALVGIVSTENDTLLTITPTRDVTIGTKSVQAGRSILVTLDRAETLLITFVGDLTGTKVTSNRPISFFCGDQCTNIPSGVRYCDQIVEQLPPVEAWERKFATAPLKTRMSFDVFRFVASENSTTVDINCTLSSGNQGYAEEFILNEGSFADVQVNSTDFCWMEADKRILLLQFAVGTTADNVSSDPFMALVPAVSHYTNSLTLPIVNSSLNDFTHYLNIIIPAEHYQPDQIFLDGQSLQSLALEFVAIVHNGETMAYAAQVEVNVTTHTLIHGNSRGRFGVVSYGFASVASYGHVGGMQLPQFSNSRDNASTNDATTAASTNATTAVTTDATTAATTDATTAASTDATTAAATNATTAAYNDMAISFILAGLMGFLVLILATVMLGTCIICICLRVCKSCRKRKKTDTDTDICATAHSVILEQNPAYDCVPVHLKPTAKKLDRVVNHHRLKAI